MRRVTFHRPESLDEALALKARLGAGARWVAGATDLLVGLREERGSEPPVAIIDLIGLDALRGIAWIEDGGQARLRVGALVTHAEIAADPLLRERARLLCEAAAEVGSPLIRNRATIGGNIVNAASCADTAPPLVALGAEMVLVSARGSRTLAVADASPAAYQSALAPDELLVEFRFVPVPSGSGCAFRKLGRRAALSISRLSVAVIVELDTRGRIGRARVAAGSLTPTVRRFPEVEEMLGGAPPSRALFDAAGLELAAAMIRITGERWSTPYKKPVAAVMLKRALADAVAEAVAKASTEVAPETAPTSNHVRGPGAHNAPSTGVSTGTAKGKDGPALPAGASIGLPPAAPAETVALRFTLNGRACRTQAPASWTLLRLLREGLLLTGTKCGCEVGQCGACTVILNGRAVTSCLVLAGQVDGAVVETVEGLSGDVRPDGTGLHPLQEAFLDHDAIACGFCTPGMLLAAKALLDENPHPTRAEIRRAISGNLCRCTGYLPIVEAIEAVAQSEGRNRGFAAKEGR